MYIEYLMKEKKAGNKDKGILEGRGPFKEKNTLGLYEPWKLNRN